MFITYTVDLDFHFSSLESVYCRLTLCFRAHFRLISEFGCRMSTVDCLERQSASLRNYPDVFLCRVVKWHVHRLFCVTALHCVTLFCVTVHMTIYWAGIIKCMVAK